MTAAVQTPDIRLSRSDITGKFAVKNCGEACTQWNYDGNGNNKPVACIQILTYCHWSPLSFSFHA
jgi:hypothetical protein